MTKPIPSHVLYEAAEAATERGNSVLAGLLWRRGDEALTRELVASLVDEKREPALDHQRDNRDDEPRRR